MRALTSLQVVGELGEDRGVGGLAGGADRLPARCGCDCGELLAVVDLVLAQQRVDLLGSGLADRGWGLPVRQDVYRSAQGEVEDVGEAG
jgi:hypothetical protein